MSDGKRHQGECKWFNSKKGFGFITPKDGSEDVFVHQSAIKAEGFRSLAEKEPVEYEVAKDDQGRLKAVNVTSIDGGNVKGAPKPRARYYNRGGAVGGGAGAPPTGGAPNSSRGRGAPRGGRGGAQQQ